MKTRPILVCRHEAAHAIVAELLGYRVLEMRVVGSKGGFCRIASKYKAEDPLRMGVVYAAGLAAEIKWHRATSRRISLDDGREIHKRGFRGRSKATILAIAQRIVDEHAGAIDCLAHLLKAKDLKRADIKRVLIAEIKAKR